MNTSLVTIAMLLLWSVPLTFLQFDWLRPYWKYSEPAAQLAVDHLLSEAPRWRDLEDSKGSFRLLILPGTYYEPRYFSPKVAIIKISVSDRDAEIEVHSWCADRSRSLFECSTTVRLEKNPDSSEWQVVFTKTTLLEPLGFWQRVRAFFCNALMFWVVYPIIIAVGSIVLAVFIVGWPVRIFFFLFTWDLRDLLPPLFFIPDILLEGALPLAWLIPMPMGICILSVLSYWYFGFVFFVAMLLIGSFLHVRFGAAAIGDGSIDIASVVGSAVFVCVWGVIIFFTRLPPEASLGFRGSSLAFW